MNQGFDQAARYVVPVLPDAVQRYADPDQVKCGFYVMCREDDRTATSRPSIATASEIE